MKKIITIVLAAAFVCAAFAQGPSLHSFNHVGGSSATAGAPSKTPAAATGQQKTSDPGASKVDVGGRSIEFNGAALDIVLMVYGNLVGKTVLKDPSVPASSITLQPKQGQELSDDDKKLAIETVLEMNGIHLEPYGDKFIRALPRGTARPNAIPLIMDPEAELKDTMRVVSVMLSFQNIALDEAQKALEGMKSDKGSLNVYERTSQILVTDTEMNIKRMREIVKKIDVPTPVTENVFVRQIKYAAAAEIKTALEAIVQESQKELEKQGKQANNAQPRSVFQPFQPGRNLINRANNQPAQQPKSNESLVTSVSDADRGMIRGKVLILSDERSNKLIIVTAKPNMDFFDKVIEQLDVETTPDIAVKVYRLKYADSEDVADMINDLIGNASSSKGSSKGNQNQNAKSGTSGNMTRSTATAVKKPANQRTGEAKTGELSKENTTVLADKRINGLVVMTNKELVPTIEQIIDSMDVKLSQVLIETVIIEVTLGDDIATGIDWVNNNWTGKDPQVKGGGGGGTSSDRLSNLTGGSSEKTFSEWASEAKSVLTSQGTYSGTAITTDEINKYIKAAQTYAANNNSMSPAAAGITYFLKSDKLNISAIISAAKTDTRSKYIASPIVMTVDNKEAVIEATEAIKFYSGSTSSSGYSTASVSYNYTDKDIGIKIKVTPKINPNGTVMLEVEEEYSQLGAGQTVLVNSGSGTGSPSRENIDTALQRKMSADVLLENRQTVVLGGLTEKYNAEKETGIPILKDIPWIGRWLFGSVALTESRKELLVFMTPYVLNEGAEAQLEALRRKRALSDARPWDDNAWSSSALADPISEKEQLRRLKAEAKTQDEERKSKMAIEQWKVDRVKQLKEMSKKERDLWLEMHKDELVSGEEHDSKTPENATQEDLRKVLDAEKAKRDAEEKKPEAK